MLLSGGKGGDGDSLRTVKVQLILKLNKTKKETIPPPDLLNEFVEIARPHQKRERQQTISISISSSDGSFNPSEPSSRSK